MGIERFSGTSAQFRMASFCMFLSGIYTEWVCLSAFFQVRFGVCIVLGTIIRVKVIRIPEIVLSYTKKRASFRITGVICVAIGLLKLR